MAIGSIGAAARQWAKQGRPFFVLWLDAHADFNTPTTTLTGNLHGMALALLCGAFGSSAMFSIPDFPPLEADKLLLISTRAVDAMEGVNMRDHRLDVVHVDVIATAAFASKIGGYLDHVRRIGGVLHVSLDLDVLDPAAAPGVAIPVPRGCQLGAIVGIMERLAAADCVHTAFLEPNLCQCTDCVFAAAEKCEA